MPLRIHVAERADAVIDPLVGLLADPPADPFDEDVIAVPTRGVERWLAQALALRLGARPGHQDGIAARLAFRFPGWVVNRALVGPGEDPDRDPWRPDAAVWELIDIVTGAADDPRLRALVDHLGIAGDDAGDDVRRGRRYRTLRHVADLFDRYGMYRPEMVIAWAGGRDVDGAGDGLPAELVWQPHLWRALRARIGRETIAERLEATCAQIRAGADLAGLPDRIAFVGVSRLPPTYLRILEAIGERRRVEMFLLHPSRALWSAAGAAGLARGPRAATAIPVAVANPLLASWGRDAGEMAAVLDRPAVFLEAADETPHTSLLAHIQADIRSDQLPGRSGRVPLDPDDRSLEIHSCHGRTRQVEVLRDALLHRFRADATLEPRDVAILCPDIEGFAPIIDAVFGGGEAEFPGPGMRVEIADRSVGATNPVVAVVARLLALADDRITVTQLLELAGLEPVRRRFGFDDGDLSRIEELAIDAGVRWGLDGADRTRFGLGALEANTWRAGLDRMLLGLAVGDLDDRAIAGVTPQAGLDTGEIDLVGRVAEFVDRVGMIVDRMRAPQPIDSWVSTIGTAADLLTDVDAEREWQRIQLGELLTELSEAAGGVRVDVARAEIRTIVDAGLGARRGAARYGTGRITAASMVPLRGVPFRVIALLGLDDGVFPRANRRDADDLMLRAPHVGDRDPRGDDVQQLLDALLAASDAVVITYSGHDERTNNAQASAVPVAELIDVIGRTVDGDLRDRVLIGHPLQPFDPVNFRPDGVAAGLVWGFDPAAAAGARVLAAGDHVATPFLEGELDAPDRDVIDLAEFVRFLERPVREFLRTRLGVVLHEVGDELPDGIPVTIDGLEKWSVGDRMLRAARAGIDHASWLAAEQARGVLPPDALGGEIVAELTPSVMRIAAAADRAQADRAAVAVAVDVALADGRRLVGEVPEVYGDVVLVASYSRISPRLRIRAWAYLLALTLAAPEAHYRSLVIARHTDTKITEPARAQVDPLAPDAARRALDGLVALYDEGMRRVPMIFTETSAAYAAWRASERGPDRGGFPWKKTRWERQSSVSPIPGENEDPAHVLVLGGRLDLDDLQVRHGDELARQAMRLWGDLLDVEIRSW